MARIAEVAEFAKGEIIFTSKLDDSTDLFFLASGFVEVQINGLQNAVFQSKELILREEMFTSSAVEYKILALENCTIYILERKKLNELMFDSIEIMKAIVNLI